MKKVLIFRLGSLGDTVVALPSFHLIARAFPEAERRVLTSEPVSRRATSLSSILDHTGLVHGYFTYFPERWDPGQFFHLWRKIREWKPEELVYLAEPRGLIGTWRDLIFFRACGIKRFFGVPYSKELRENQWQEDRNVFEHESERLERCLKELGNARTHDVTNWDLKLTDQENELASHCLEDWAGREHFLAGSIVAKVGSKDWGKGNWSLLLSVLSRNYPDLGLVLVGAEADFQTSEEISQAWRGPLLNLSGRLTPRQSAALMKRALLYLGHDSGPMHLAAAMGIPCIAIFVTCMKPGVWFPYGERHRVVFNPLNGQAETPIPVDEVLKIVLELIEKKRVNR